WGGPRGFRGEEGEGEGGGGEVGPVVVGSGVMDVTDDKESHKNALQNVLGNVPQEVPVGGYLNMYRLLFRRHGVMKLAAQLKPWPQADSKSLLSKGGISLGTCKPGARAGTAAGAGAGEGSPCRAGSKRKGRHEG
ncbi:unnamed protein product, partial [Discosporangium mesarthrocarpum]